MELLPLINQGNIELLDDKRQTSQLITLERNKGRTGKETITHPPNGHDDRANSLALAAYSAKKRSEPFFFSFDSGQERMATAETYDIFGESLRRIGRY